MWTSGTTPAASNNATVIVSTVAQSLGRRNYEFDPALDFGGVQIQVTPDYWGYVRRRALPKGHSPILDNLLRPNGNLTVNIADRMDVAGAVFLESNVSRHEGLLYDRYASGGASDYLLDQAAINELGLASYRRVQLFQGLKAGWSFGDGKPLALESLKSAEKFLREYGQPIRANFGYPLCFLNSEGEVELKWRKPGEAEIFLRFHSDSVDYLIFPGDEEGTSTLKAVSDLVTEKLHHEAVAA